jgi:hypothetical protein
VEDETTRAAGERSLDATETWGQGRDQSHPEGLASALGPETRGATSGPETTDEAPDGLGGLRQEPPEPAPPRIEDQPEGRTIDAGSDTGFGRPER